MRSLTYSGISTKGIMYILHNMAPNWLSLPEGHTISSQIANACVNMNFQERRAIETCEKVSAYISTKWGPTVGLKRELRIMDCMISEEEVQVKTGETSVNAKTNIMTMAIPYSKSFDERIRLTVRQLGEHSERGAGEVYTNDKIRGGDLRMMPSGVFSINISYPYHDFERIAILATNLLFSHLRDIMVEVDLPSRSGVGQASITNKALAAISVFSVARSIRGEDLGSGGVLLDMALDGEF